MVDEKNDFKTNLRKIVFRALKGTIKGVLFYALYLVLFRFLVPIPDIVPGFQQAIETFVMIYVFLIIADGLTSGTIFHHFFNATRALFVIGYLIFSLKGGILGVPFQNVNLTVDLRLFLTIAIFLSFLGFAKSVLQAINYLNEKSERGGI